jgi:hypothetical protein
MSKLCLFWIDAVNLTVFVDFALRWVCRSVREFVSSELTTSSCDRLIIMQYRGSNSIGIANLGSYVYGSSPSSVFPCRLSLAHVSEVV